MGDDVNDSPKNDGPSGGLVEGDILVERDNVTQGCTTQQGDKIPAHGKKNKSNINVEDEGGGPGGGW